MVEKSLCMVHGENTVVVRYALVSPSSGPVTLELRPLIAFRDYHALTHENPALDATPELVNSDPYAAGWLFEIVPDDAAALSGLLDAVAYRATTEA